MVFLLVRVHASVWWWAGCCVNLWVRQGNPGEGGGVVPGVLREVERRGKAPRRGHPGWTATRRGWERGDAEAGPSEGEEKREFKLLTLLVFFK